LNAHRVSNDNQIEIHTTAPLVPDPSPLEVETAIAKLERYKSPGSDQIPAELKHYINLKEETAVLPMCWEDLSHYTASHLRKQYS
jgi:hypothetical protein